MGLDMYFTKRKYVKNWEHDKENKWDITVKHNGNLVEDKMPIKELVFEAGYWRKANAIHQWFVDNVQDGEDDCKEYFVERELMQELLETINKVLAASELVAGDIQNGTRYENGKETPIMEKGKYIKDPTVASELLPTQEGFFFGGTNYDQYYYDDLVNTKAILEEALKDNESDYYYRSSW